MAFWKVLCYHNRMNRFILFALPVGIFVLLGAWWYQNDQQALSSSSAGSTTSPADPKSKVLNGVDFSDGASVDVIDFEGDYLLVSKLRIGEPHPRHADGPGCGSQHWHTDSQIMAVNTGAILSDPVPNGCGFGTIQERSVLMYFPHELLAD